jgi:hypothetical protein
MDTMNTECIIVTVRIKHHDGTDDRASVETPGLEIQNAIDAFRGALMGVGFSPNLVEMHLPEQYRLKEPEAEA